jgi:3-hydroxyacyl-CoA dehydrogenase
MEAFNDCDLVIEAVSENIGLKEKIFSQFGTILKDDCIVASNTSSLSIKQLAEFSSLPERVIGLHFFNPVQLMKLVEIVGTEHNTDAVITKARSYVQHIGKVPVSCSDTPGFIVNRLLVPNLAQALAMLDRGVATKEDIDISMQLGAGHPMGPITLADYVGLDTCLSILEGWVQNFPDEPAFIIPNSLKRWWPPASWDASLVKATTSGRGTSV